MTQREERLSNFIDPAFLDESFTERPLLSVQPATENVELLSNFLDPELLDEVMSMLKPDKDDAATSASVEAAEEDEADSEQPVAGRHAKLVLIDVRSRLNVIRWTSGAGDGLLLIFL